MYVLEDIYCITELVVVFVASIYFVYINYSYDPLLSPLRTNTNVCSPFRLLLSTDHKSQCVKSASIINKRWHGFNGCRVKSSINVHVQI